MQNQSFPTGNVVGPTPQPTQPTQPMQPTTAGPAPGVNPNIVTTNVVKAKGDRTFIETIILIIVSLVAAVFIGLFVFMYIQWDSARTDVDGQIDKAVAIAVDENAAKLQAEFTEKEKYPYATFSGPEEYGSLSFEYPKTWSVYVAKDNADGGSFEAYFNPGEVSPVTPTTINSLRVSIVAKSVENVTQSYDSNLKKGLLKQSTYTFSDGNTVGFYEGEFPSSKLHGASVVFKLRDKTATIQTDAEIFRADFEKLLKTVTYTQ